jgi:hypothetical protein
MFILSFISVINLGLVALVSISLFLGQFILFLSFGV